MIDLPSQSLAEIKTILAREVPEYAVWVFGSRIKGTAQPYSDLDLALVGDKPLEWQRIEALKDRFSESQLPIIIDIVDWQQISDDFKKIIKDQYEVIQS